jgi:2-dehydropantoate 2-reductase
MNIAIIGVGGVGGYFGGKLAAYSVRSGKHNIYFIARCTHLDAIRSQSGLILATQDEGELLCRPTHATDNIDELPPLDLALLCVKSYDLDPVLVCLRSKIEDGTRIIPLQNGVDVYERFRNRIDSGIIYPACAYIGARIERPGVVVQNGGACEILFGEDPGHAGDTPEEILSLFHEAGIKYRWLGNNPYNEIWKKFMFICAFSLVTAAEGKTLGQVMESGESGRSVLSVMREIYAISVKKGVMLPESVIREAFDKGYSFPFDAKTSFQRDFENRDKPDERDLFGGTVTRLGEELGIETPFTMGIYEKLDSIKKI